MTERAHAALRPIIAKDQVRLGAGRGLRLAMSGMSYRMFRSGVTIAILSLATAFLVHILSYGLLQQATERQAFNELTRQRQLGQSMTRLSDVDLDSAVIEGLASKQPARLAEYGRWSGSGDSALSDAVTIAQRLRNTELTFTDYPVAVRAVILGDLSAEEFLLQLRQDHLSRLDAQLHQLGVRPPLGSFDTLRSLIVSELPRLRNFIAAAQQGQLRAIRRLSDSFSGKSLAEVLRQPSPELTERVREAGYALTASDLANLSKLESRTSDVAALNRALQNGEVTTEIGRLASVEASKVDFESLSTYVTQMSRARSVQKWLVRAGAPATLGAQRILELTTAHVRETKLARALGDQAFEPGAGHFGLSERNQWLVVLSFLVCVVGVANAMLMSVTERFTEIATMKCLGAMDGFVMMMFVFEAMIQGVVGGLVGLIVGVLLAVMRAAVEYGSLLTSAAGVVSSVLAAMAVSLLVSVALAAIAAVGPAWLAARLSPMEAMRVE